jgi:ATP-dependent 26S proteasome regulatory subunit
MKNLHPYLAGPDGRIINPTLLQFLQHVIEIGETQSLHVIVLAYPGIPIPLELEKMVRVVDHDLPDSEELWQLLNRVEVEKRALPQRNTPEAQLILDAAAGLTRIEASGAFALSLARHSKVQTSAIWELKEDMIKKNGLLEMSHPVAGFEMIGGLNHMKDFCLRAIGSPNKSKRTRSRGIVCVGVPGVGKSMFATALGYEVGLPTVLLNLGNLMGGIVGKTEEQTRRALKTIEAMAPCVLYIDEIDKALSGAGGGALDSGVSDRQFGTLLTWFNDHESDIFTIATCNDISRLATASKGAFTRAGRFDALFFVDLPSPEQRRLIWDIYETYFELSPAQKAERPDDNKWTGAEIKACCNMAKLLSETLKEAAVRIVPVAKSNAEQINALRDFAHQRYLSADWKGVYDRNGEPKFMPACELTGNTRRRVIRGKSA